MRLFDSARRHLKRLWFRVCNGFWPEEWYSLDTALAKWLSVRLAYMSLYSSGAPQSYAEMHGEATGFNEWKSDLKLVADDLKRYSERWNAATTDEEKEIEQSGEAAMFWVATFLKDLWD